MPKHILVTGANGQLGRELQSLVQKKGYTDDIYKFYFTDRSTLDICDIKSVETFIQEYEIGAVVNCAAYTAVDQAENDEIAANLVNHIAVENLAKISKKNNLKFIHISTDYVFDGQFYTPIDESQATNPQGVYASTKLAGEKVLESINPAQAIIIRTSWVYSTFGSNFVDTMLRLGNERDALNIISDQIGSPTYARDLAKAILDILPQMSASQNVEIYHYSNAGVASWYDFAQAIFDIKNITCDVTPISTDEYPTLAVRPHYSVLKKDKIRKKYNLKIPYWRDSLKECLEILS